DRNCDGQRQTLVRESRTKEKWQTSRPSVSIVRGHQFLLRRGTRHGYAGKAFGIAGPRLPRVAWGPSPATGPGRASHPADPGDSGDAVPVQFLLPQSLRLRAA